VQNFSSLVWLAAQELSQGLDLLYVSSILVATVAVADPHLGLATDQSVLLSVMLLELVLE
jgi:hypothetical protein